MPNMISTCGGFFEDLGNTVIKFGGDYLSLQQQILTAKAQQKISDAQAQTLLAQARAQSEQAAAQKAIADAEFKKKLPLYIGGGIAALALLYFVTRRR
jgi:multidrug efflux pump subunit AcrA (membrane-fusion protein)